MFSCVRACVWWCVRDYTMNSFVSCLSFMWKQSQLKLIIIIILILIVIVVIFMLVLSMFCCSLYSCYFCFYIISRRCRRAEVEGTQEDRSLVATREGSVLRRITACLLSTLNVAWQLAVKWMSVWLQRPFTPLKLTASIHSPEAHSVQKPR